MNTDYSRSQYAVNSALTSSEANKAVDNKTKPPGFCAWLAHGTVNCARRFSVGAAAASIMTPLALGTSFLAQKAGLIQKMAAPYEMTKEAIANVSKQYGINLDGDAIAKAACPMQEYVTQCNKFLHPELQHTVFSVKAHMFGFVGVGLPIFEEIVFRGLIQDLLLKRIPKYIVKWIAPGKEVALDSAIVEAARITLTAAIFSAFHLANSGLMTDSHVSMQLVATFVLGIGFGALKESKAGLLGSTGAHITNNIWAIIPQLLRC